MLETVTEIPPQVEFIAIYCSRAGRNESSDKKFVDAFAFISEKAEYMKKHSKTIQDEYNKGHFEDKMSVVIFGLDSVSNMNFIRSFPLTRTFLTQDLDAIIMDGYVKVGG